MSALTEELLTQGRAVAETMDDANGRALGDIFARLEAEVTRIEEELAAATAPPAPEPAPAADEAAPPPSG
jgi:hypothetical protein